MRGETTGKDLKTNKNKALEDYGKETKNRSEYDGGQYLKNTSGVRGTHPSDESDPAAV